MLKKIVLVLIAVVIGFLVFALTRPATYRVQRTVEIQATPEAVYDQLEDFRAWSRWSPWEKLDPQMKKSFSGPERGVGATYAWQGNDKVGTGRMTITKSDRPRDIECRLEFLKPFEAVSQTSMQLQPRGAVTHVTWTMTGHNDFTGKVFSVFMNMEKSIGEDFEAGLARLKEITETVEPVDATK
jgi:uncharacterized protein YndB with AHSA1/START domain